MKRGWKVKVLHPMNGYFGKGNPPSFTCLAQEGTTGYITKVFGEVYTVDLDNGKRLDFHEVFSSSFERIPRFEIGEKIYPIKDIEIKDESGNVVGKYAKGEEYTITTLINPDAAKMGDDFSYIFEGASDTSNLRRSGCEMWLLENFYVETLYEVSTSNVKNNDGRTSCYKCGGALKEVDTGFSRMSICKNCGA